MKNILILESNPIQDLALNQEIRDLEGVIDRSRDREQFSIKTGLAVRPEDLQELILKHQPHIVHFCGHGTGDQGLVFQDATGHPKTVSTAALSSLCALCAEFVECVLLNACYSDTQADAIVQHINYVIGMRQAIRDDAARYFAQGFYRALGYGKPIELAYQWGCNAIQLMLASPAPPLSATPEPARKLVPVEPTSPPGINLPEHLKPILRKKANLAEELIEPTPDHQLQHLQQALAQEQALSQYRDRVRQILADRTLTDVETLRLEQLRTNLGLSEEIASQILQEEQAPLQQARDEYRDLLMRLIQAGHYPFSAEIEAELQQLQHELHLTKAEVEGIAQPILLAAVPSQKLPQTQTVEFEVITLDANAQVTDRSRHQAECWSEALAPETSLEMVQIPGGTFLMGSSEEACTTPPHTVTVPSFSMGQYPVTQAQWRVVAALPPVERPLNPDPSHFSGDRHPVEQVSWLEAVEFCQRLSKMTGRAYRLPTEAEWEYACRAGTTTRFHFGDTIRPHLANYNAGNLATFMISFLRGSTTEIGHFQVANRFGLYDMHGNVWEWCLDTWHDTYEGTPVDGSAWIDATASSHVVRGGSWDFNPAGCRSAFRLKHATDAHYDFLGFRIVC